MAGAACASAQGVADAIVGCKRLLDCLASNSLSLNTTGPNSFLEHPCVCRIGIVTHELGAKDQILGRQLHVAVDVWARIANSLDATGAESSVAHPLHIGVGRHCDAEGIVGEVIANFWANCDEPFLEPRPSLVGALLLGQSTPGRDPVVRAAMTGIRPIS